MPNSVLLKSDTLSEKVSKIKGSTAENDQVLKENYILFILIV